MFASRISKSISLGLFQSSSRLPLIFSTRYLYSSAFGRLDETYDKEMLTRLARSHEALALPSKLETVAAAESPKLDLQSVGTLLNRAIVRMKHWGKQDYTQELKQLNTAMLSMMYNKNLKLMYQNFAYDKKFMYPRIIFAFRAFLNATQKTNPVNKEDPTPKLIRLATCFECMSLGYFLQDQLGATEMLKKKMVGSFYGLSGSMGWIEKYLRDERIILAGDFFHTKASKISADFGIVEIPYFLAVIEEALAKVDKRAVFKREQVEQTKDFSDLNNQLYISYYDTALMLSLALKGTCILMNDDAGETLNEALTNFSLHFGLAWYLVAAFSKQYPTLQENMQNTSGIDAFLEAETKRLQQSNRQATLKALVDSHLLEAKRSLMGLTGEEEKVREFVEDQLVPIVGINAIKGFSYTLPKH